MWLITVVFSDGAGRWALSSRTRYRYSDWLLLRLHATTSHCLRTTRWILVSSGSQHSELLDFATNRVRTQSQCFVALCSLTSEHEKPSLEVAPTTLLLTYSFQFRSIFQPTMLSWLFCVIVYLCICAFVVLNLVSSVLCQKIEIGQEERLPNDLLCVEWDVKH